MKENQANQRTAIRGRTKRYFVAVIAMVLVLAFSTTALAAKGNSGANPPANGPDAVSGATLQPPAGNNGNSNGNGSQTNNGNGNQTNKRNKAKIGAPNLDKIEKAIAANPDEPAVQDSMGWALHKLGRNAEALPFLKKAFEGQHDAEVAAHLATVLWELDKKDEARSMLRLARELDPDNRALRAAVQRIGE